MVFIYHRLFRPRLTEFLTVPRFARNLFYSFKRRFYPELQLGPEPTKPEMKTNYPGPNMKNLNNDCEIVSHDYLNALTYINYEKSRGSYMVDCDGNTFVDFFSNISSLPLGYNHPKLIQFNHQDQFTTSFVNKVDLNNYYPSNIAELYQNTVQKIHPKNLQKVLLTCGCGSSANELAFKISMQRRGPISKNIRNASMDDFNNQWSVLSFQHGFHGRLGGTLSATRNKPIHKIGFPHYNWPVGRFPNLKYPLSSHIQENNEEIARCLEDTEKILRANQKISAMIIEPVQSEGGDHWATPEYFRQLRKLAKDFNIDFIVDEVQTGMTTGRWFEHEVWGLQTPPDMVTFSKKYQVSGLYINNDAIPSQLNSETCGEGCVDVYRLNLLSKIINVIEEDNLLQQAERTGEYFKSGAKKVAESNKVFSDIRGRGSLLAFNLPNSDLRNQFVSFARNRGLFVFASGDNTVRLRPALTIRENEYNFILNEMEKFDV